MENCTVHGKENEKLESKTEISPFTYDLTNGKIGGSRRIEVLMLWSSLVMTVSENVVLINVCSPAKKVKIWNSYFMVRPVMNSEVSANIDI